MNTIISLEHVTFMFCNDLWHLKAVFAIFFIFGIERVILEFELKKLELNYKFR
jgi:hypothetical protein